MKITRSIMGMPITVQVLDRADARDLIEEVMDYFIHIDEVFSPYRDTSDISRLNAGTLQPGDVTREVAEVLASCEALKQETGGYFDISRAGRLDPSGYVKGWAIYQAARILDGHLASRYLVDAGGDMQLRGSGPTDQPWVVGIGHPFLPGVFAKRLQLTDCAVATSGTYMRGNHIYDPKTGQPVRDPISLTVVGPTIDRADALATAAFCMGRDGLRFLQDRALEAMMVTADRAVTMTPGFKRYESAGSK